MIGAPATCTPSLPNGQTYPIEGRLQFSEVTVDQTTGAVTLRASFGNGPMQPLPTKLLRLPQDATPKCG